MLCRGKPPSLPICFEKRLKTSSFLVQYWFMLLHFITLNHKINDHMIEKRVEEVTKQRTNNQKAIIFLFVCFDKMKSE